MNCTRQQQALLLALTGDRYIIARGSRAGPARMNIRSCAAGEHLALWRLLGRRQPAIKDTCRAPRTGGWDYFDIAFNKRIALNWSYTALMAPGYKTDGRISSMRQSSYASA
jgi:hypothetical protein